MEIRKKLDLQFFAEEEEQDESLLQDDDIDEETDEEEEEEENLTPKTSKGGKTTEEETDEDETEGDEEGEESTNTPQNKSNKTPNLPEDNNALWQKRVERLKRSEENRFLEEANSLSDGVQLGKGDIPKAVRLWNMLVHNPELSTEVNEIITKALSEKKAKELHEISGTTKIGSFEARLAVKEAKLDMKLSDPVYRKYESQILDWAEDNEFDIKSAKDLAMIVKAWKGENSAVMTANMANKAKQKAETEIKSKQDAKLAGKVAKPVKGINIDYKKASDRDILKAEGLSLFSDD